MNAHTEATSTPAEPVASMGAHTPGPWEFVPKLSASENHKGFFVREEKPAGYGKWALAEVQPGDEDGKIGAANAKLIAAAPELLAAVTAFIKYDAEDCSDGAVEMANYVDAITKAHAALAKSA